jgi:hypothetical protein
VTEKGEMRIEGREETSELNSSGEGDGQGSLRLACTGMNFTSSHKRNVDSLVRERGRVPLGREVESR